MMTIIKLQYNCKASEDGFSVKQFNAGVVYDVRESCARELFAKNAAVKASLKDAREFVLLNRLTVRLERMERRANLRAWSESPLRQMCNTVINGLGGY